MDIFDTNLGYALIPIGAFAIIRGFNMVMGMMHISLFEPVTGLLENLVMPFAGVATVILGIHLGIEYMQLASRSIPTDGAVISVSPHQTRCPGFRAFVSRYGCEYVTLEFKDRLGQTISTRARFSTPHDAYRKGQSVKILYLEKGPQETAMISSAGVPWSDPALVIAAGFGMIIYGAIRFVEWRRSSRRRRSI